MQPSSSLTSKSAPKNVRYWSQYLLLQDLQEQIPQETLQAFLSNLENNEYSSLGIEQKFRVQVGGRSWVMYSARITQAARILFMPLDGTIMILDYLPNHEYDASKFMKREYFTKFAQSFASEQGDVFEIQEDPKAQEDAFYTELHDLKDIDSNWRLTWSDKGSFVILNERQEQIYSTPLPAVCSGLPGVGKSVVLVDCLYTAVERFEASEEAPRARFAYISKGDEVVTRERKRYLEQPFSQREECQSDFILAIEWYTDPSTWTIAQIEGWIDRNKRSYLALKEWACPQIFQELTFIHALNKDFEAYIDLRGRLIGESQVQQALRSLYENFSDTILTPNASVEGFKWPSQAQEIAEGLLYDSVYIDEAQNFTVNELLYYLLQRSKDGRVLFAQDVEQTLSFKGSDLFQVLRAIYHRLQKNPGVGGRSEIATIYLQRSYRCLPNIAFLGSRLLATKRTVLGGDVSRGGDRSMQRQEESWVGTGASAAMGPETDPGMNLQNGDVRWFQSQSDLDAIRSYLPENTYEWAVLVRTSADLSVARKFFGEDAVILLVTQAQGIEFKLVVFFNPCDHSLIHDAYGPIHDRGQGVERLKAGSTAMNEVQLAFSSWIGEVFTGVTRAREGIWVVDLTQGKLSSEIKAFFKDIHRSAYLQNAKKPCEIVFSATTLHGWSRMITTLIDGQQWEMAARLYDRNMAEQTTISFEQWCSSQGLIKKQAPNLSLAEPPLSVSDGSIRSNTSKTGKFAPLKDPESPAIEERMPHDKIMRSHRVLDQNDKKKPKDFSESLTSSEWSPLALHQILFQESSSPKKPGFWNGTSLFWAIQSKPVLKDALQTKLLNIKKMTDLLGEEFFSLPSPQSLLQVLEPDLEHSVLSEIDSGAMRVPGTLAALTLVALAHPDMWALIIKPFFEKINVQTRRNLWKKCRLLEEYVGSQDGAVASALAQIFGFSMIRRSPNRGMAPLTSSLSDRPSIAEKSSRNTIEDCDLSDPLLPIASVLKIMQSKKTSWNTWKGDARYKDLPISELGAIAKQVWKNFMLIGMTHFYRDECIDKFSWLRGMNLFWAQIFAEGSLSHEPCSAGEVFVEVCNEILIKKSLSDKEIAYAYLLDGGEILDFLVTKWRCNLSKIVCEHFLLSSPNGSVIEEPLLLLSLAGIRAHDYKTEKSKEIFKALIDLHDNMHDREGEKTLERVLLELVAHRAPNAVLILLEHISARSGGSSHALKLFPIILDCLIDFLPKMKDKTRNSGTAPTATIYQYINPWRSVLRYYIHALKGASADQWMTPKKNTLFHLAACFSSASNPDEENGAANGVVLQELFGIHASSMKMASESEQIAYKDLLSVPRAYQGASDRYRTEPFSTPLCLAVRSHNMNALRLLLAQGAIIVQGEQNAIEYAIRENNSMALLDCLKKVSDSSDLCDYLKPCTPGAFCLAMTALQYGTGQILDALETYGVDFSLPESPGTHTPLTTLSLLRLSKQALSLIARLRMKGGEHVESIRAVSMSGGQEVTALTYAAESGDYCLMAELIHAGCSPLREEEMFGHNILLMAILNKESLPAQRVMSLVMQYLEKIFEAHPERVLAYINKTCLRADKETTVVIEAILSEKYQIAIRQVDLGADCAAFDRRALVAASCSEPSGATMRKDLGDLIQKMLGSLSMEKSPLLKGPFLMKGEIEDCPFENHLVRTALLSQNYLVAANFIAHGVRCSWNVDAGSGSSNILIESLSPNLPVVSAVLDRLQRDREQGFLSNEQVRLMINGKNPQGETVWDRIFAKAASGGADSRYVESMSKGIVLGASLWERDLRGIPAFFHLLGRETGAKLLQTFIAREIQDGCASKLRENFAQQSNSGVSALEWLFVDNRQQDLDPNLDSNTIYFQSDSEQIKACGLILLEHCSLGLKGFKLAQLAIDDQSEILALAILENIAINIAQQDGIKLRDLFHMEFEARDLGRGKSIMPILKQSLDANCMDFTQRLCAFAQEFKVSLFSPLMNSLRKSMSDSSMARVIALARNARGALLGRDLEMYIQSLPMMEEMSSVPVGVNERDLVAYCLRNTYSLTLESLIESGVCVLDRPDLSEDLFTFCISAKKIGLLELELLRVLIEHAITQGRLREFLFQGEASQKDVWGLLWEMVIGKSTHMTPICQNLLLRSLTEMDNHHGLRVRSRQQGVISTAFAADIGFFEQIVKALSGRPDFMKMTLEKGKYGETIWTHVFSIGKLLDQREGLVHLLLEGCVLTKSDRENLGYLRALVKQALQCRAGSVAVQCFDKWHELSGERYFPVLPEEDSERSLIEKGHSSSKSVLVVEELDSKENDIKMYCLSKHIDIGSLECIFDIESSETGSEETRDLAQKNLCEGIVRDAIDRGQVETLRVCQNLLIALEKLKKRRGFPTSFTYVSLVQEIVQTSMEKSERERAEDFLFGHARLLHFFSTSGISFECLGTKALALAAEFQNWDVLMILMENFGSGGSLLESLAGSQNLARFFDPELYKRPGVETLMRLVSWKQERAGHSIVNYKQCKNFITMQCTQKHKQAGMSGVIEFLEDYAVGGDKTSIAKELAACFHPEDNRLAPVLAGSTLFPLTAFDLTKWAQERSLRGGHYHQAKEYQGVSLFIQRSYSWDNILLQLTEYSSVSSRGWCIPVKSLCEKWSNLIGNRVQRGAPTYSMYQLQDPMPKIVTEADLFSAQIMDKQFSIFCALMRIDNSSWAIPEPWRDLGELVARGVPLLRGQKPRGRLQEILQNYLGDGVDSETNLVQWMRLYSRLQGVVLFRAYSNQCEMSTNERKERFQVLLAFARMCNPTPTEQGLEWPLFMAMMATQGIEGIYSQALLVVEECLVREIVMKLTGDKREDFAHLVLIALKTLCMESLIAYKMKAKVELNRAELYGSHSGKSEDLYKQYESERENFVTSFYPHLREIYPDGPVEGAEIVNPPSMILGARPLTFSSGSVGASGIIDSVKSVSKGSKGKKK